MAETDEGTTAAAEKAATEKAAADEAATTAAEKAQAEEAALGDAGKQAIDRMKAERTTARAEAKEAREALAALQAKIDGKEAEHAATTAQAERDAAALAKADERIISAEVRAAATGKLANPMLAIKLLDLSEFEVKEDGNVDSAAISAAVDALLEENPGLAVQDGKRFRGNADGGTRKESGPAQLTAADVTRMTKEKDFEGIVKAKAEGRLQNLLTGTG